MATQETQIQEIIAYYKTAKLPKGVVKLDDYELIRDISLFVSSHISVIESNMGEKSKQPYLDRLLELKQILDSLEQNEYHIP
jgi:hypothetical protein